jgi:phosphoribosylformimino-5-aminoimidazole carboxamide ribotide isomerase
MIKSHVLGSESLQSLADYDHARLSAGPAAPLSLDFRGDEFVGPRALLEDAALWPDRVIVMTLARVGSGEGPDLARLASIVSRAGQREIYAAGGVRHGDDLRALRDIGVAGALVATALHTGKITAADLEAICQPAA